MTATTLGDRAPAAPVWIQAAAVGSGVGILLARPALATGFGWTTPTVLAVFGAVLALGLSAPVTTAPLERRVSPAMAGLVLAVGMSVFIAGRLLSGGHSPDPATGYIIGLNTVAAVAEEALFRRVAFDALLRAGPGCAIVGSAVLFGLAHATVYGWWALPVDISAGLLLSWQRWASGTWAVPAITHAFADLLVVI